MKNNRLKEYVKLINKYGKGPPPNPPSDLIDAAAPAPAPAAPAPAPAPAAAPTTKKTSPSVSNTTQLVKNMQQSMIDLANHAKFDDLVKSLNLQVNKNAILECGKNIQSGNTITHQPDGFWQDKTKTGLEEINKIYGKLQDKDLINAVRGVYATIFSEWDGVGLRDIKANAVLNKEAIDSIIDYLNHSSTQVSAARPTTDDMTPKPETISSTLMQRKLSEEEEAIINKDTHPIEMSLSDGKKISFKLSDFTSYQQLLNSQGLSELIINKNDRQKWLSKNFKKIIEYSKAKLLHNILAESGAAADDEAKKIIGMAEKKR